MPVMDGLEAVSRIKQEFPDTKVVFVTSDSGAQIKDKCMALGALAVLPKLSRQEELCELVGKLFGPCHLFPHR
jgi:CheY-like chemotaxis protein